MEVAMSATIPALIERVTKGEGGEGFARVAHKYSALPLSEGWFAWALLTERATCWRRWTMARFLQLLSRCGRCFSSQEPKRYPELIALLPVRSTAGIDCPRCEGTGRMSFGSGKSDVTNAGHLDGSKCLLTPRWSARVKDKVPSPNAGVRAAQLNR